MNHPAIARTNSDTGWVLGWGRLGVRFAWSDPPLWRWPRIEFHRHDGAVWDVIVGWRLTGLHVAWMER
jgi:hypothetical protein